MTTLRRTVHLVLAPALALGAGCNGDMTSTEFERENEARYVYVKARLENGAPVIVKHVHDTDLFRPGDTISFVCDCDEGLEFTVSEPKLALVEPDALYHLIEAQDGDTLEAKLNSLRTRVALAVEWLRSPTRGADFDEREESMATSSAASCTGEDLEPPEHPAGFLRLLLGCVEEMFPPDPDARLVPDWINPEYHPGGERIGPFVVGHIEHPSIWKFAWRVRVVGSPDYVEWDPHVKGHPDIEY